MIQYFDVKKTYRSGVEALKGVSFEIETGEFVFIIGKSGSGKSTLLKCITREEDPTEGKVMIDNFDISHMSRALIPVLRRNIGMIYQDFRLIESKTVEENIAFVGEVVGIPKKNLAQTVRLVLNVVGLKEKAHTYPQELSGGEQQRVAIARAMVNNPKLIVADEPTGNLDPETSESIMALLLDINRSGTTVIVCTHDSNMVDRMKKRVIEVDNGYIVRDEYASSYLSEEEKRPSPITAEQMAASGMDVPVGISFGDEDSYEDDSDYGDNFDDDQFVHSSGHMQATVAPMPVYFGESEAKPAEETIPEPAAPEERVVPLSIPMTEEINEPEPEAEPVPEMLSFPAEEDDEEQEYDDAPTLAEVKEARKKAKEAARIARMEEKKAQKMARTNKKNKVRPAPMINMIPEEPVEKKTPKARTQDLDILEDDD
ncbi:MAG: cell division ATP-binding protein FtsE [Clostridiales bacterium]|nr:cell division ATP-binding protein FtsE [Clostridiales bacterium]